jgi:hypothetical protein
MTGLFVKILALCFAAIVWTLEHVEKIFSSKNK